MSCDNTSAEAICEAITELYKEMFGGESEDTNDTSGED